MSNGYLLVSNTTTAICDEDESNYVILGKIEWDHIPELIIEPGKMKEPGQWEFVLKGDFREALHYETPGERKAFRVKRENGHTCSSEGFFLLPPKPVGDGIFELTIQASGKRVVRC